MVEPELTTAAALLAAALLESEERKSPEHAAELYFCCLDALLEVAQKRQGDLKEEARIARQVKPWDVPKNKVPSLAHS